MVDDHQDDIPNSEMVPSSHAKCSSILRVAHHFRRNYPRIAYLCVHGALEESKRINPLLLDRGVPQIRFSLMCWIQRNDETGEQGQILPNTDVTYLQSFCQDYYEKTIVALITAIGIKYLKAIDSTSSASTSLPNDNQASTIVNVRAVSDQLIYACKTACVLFKVLELLSKDAQLPPEVNLIIIVSLEEIYCCPS
ncbi:hypothetical protein ISN45_Aa04g016600 [Arabidopsis thaliana x Arabidopsis arenosa]|uniref:Uncharacterized protein n=1 Tax=Arabidopsis thaliana x Arabidopsis arenosa TaxID=1240361 RepID=A0A8T2AA92_9BRAS|nr:hypothetical protein ISN45_Aa04g016600 [Arabidopsis thaliana x Arabidopsis arenosa]